MKLSTKAMIGVLFIGACYNSMFLKAYKEAFDLMTIILIVIIVWRNESK